MPKTFKVVSQEEFFASVGQLDVHPTPQGRWDPTVGDYRVHWKRPNGEVVGLSFGGTYKVLSQS